MEEQKHSGIGIASFIISIISGVLIFMLVVIATIIEGSTPGGMNEDSIGAIIIGLFVFLFLGMALVALALGIVGILQKGRKKIFAILGTVFSGVSFAVTIFIIILGLLVG